MRPKKYPLDPLARVRAKKVDVAARALADASLARAEAERARALAAARSAEAEETSAAVRAGEREALARGELTAADLMRAEAWSARVQVERDELARREAESVAREGKAGDAEAQARADVAGRKADAELVARDRARWTDAERKRAEAKDEEAAAEGWRPKRT